MIGPAIASSSSGRPAATSFDIELRSAPGVAASVFRVSAVSTAAPLATAMAHASRAAPSIFPAHAGSPLTSPTVF